MELTAEQDAILQGERGEAMAKMMKSLVMYGETFGATKMVAVTSRYGHVVTSFAPIFLRGVFGIIDQIVLSGAKSLQPFTIDPRPYDKNVPATFLQKMIFRAMYSPQKHYEAQLKKLGLLRSDAFTCACYLDEVGNKPRMGDVLSWAESSAVSFANSVLGARCNRNSGMMELFGSILGFVPFFGLLTDDGRRADLLVEVKTSRLPEAQLLGSAVGMKALERVPFITGLDKWLGGSLEGGVLDYLKDFGAAAASNGSVGLYHVENLTPEAKKTGRALLRENAEVCVIDDAALQKVKSRYPVLWRDKNAFPRLCFVGCPHLSFFQLENWAEKILARLSEGGRKKLRVKTVFTTAPAVAEKFKKTLLFAKLKKAGGIVSSICPIMYMSNPLCAKMPVATNSNKLRTYSTARYFGDEETLNLIAGGQNG